MNGKRMVTVAALVLALGLGIPALGGAHSPGFGGGPGWGGHMMGQGGGPGWGGHMMGFGGGFNDGPVISLALNYRDELKLTADQVKKLETLRDDYYRKALQAQNEIQIAQLDLQRALGQDKVNTADAEKKIRALSQKQADLQIARLKTIEQGKAILTQEQLKKLREAASSGYGRGPAYGRGYGMGPGYGRGYGMMGPGYGRGGYGMGPGYGQGGYGMGPGHGPGMMGPGYGPGMMGPGWGQGPSESR